TDCAESLSTNALGISFPLTLSFAATLSREAPPPVAASARSASTVGWVEPHAPHGSRCFRIQAAPSSAIAGAWFASAITASAVVSRSADWPRDRVHDSTFVLHRP